MRKHFDAVVANNNKIRKHRMVAFKNLVLQEVRLSAKNDWNLSNYLYDKKSEQIS